MSNERSNVAYRQASVINASDTVTILGGVENAKALQTQIDTVLNTAYKNYKNGLGFVVGVENEVKETYKGPSLRNSSSDE